MHTAIFTAQTPQLPRQPKHPQKSPPEQMHPTATPSSGFQTTAPSKETSLCKRDWEDQIVQRVSKSHDSEAVCSCSGLKKRQRHLCDWLLVKSQLGPFAGCRAEPIIPAHVRIRQKDGKSKASLNQLVTPCLKKASGVHGRVGGVMKGKRKI